MPNTTLNLSIPAELKDKAIKQAQEQHFSSTSDYLQYLIRTDAEQAEDKNRLSAFLEAGLDSGEAKEMTLEELSAWMKRVIKEV